MHFSATIITVVAAITSFVSAAPTPDVEEQATKDVIGPFALEIQSSNSTWNKKFVSHVHIGAAYNLAVPSTFPNPYYLNITEGKTITYTEIPTIPYHANIGVDLSSNIAGLYISVDQPTYGFEFDKQGHLQINGLERWFVRTIYTPYGPMAGILGIGNF